MKKLYISTKPYEIRKSREKGELDLLELADKSKKEGAWAFLHDRTCWHNITIGHKVLENDRLSVATDVKDYSIYGRRVTHYHTHPYCVEERYRQCFESLAKLMRNYEQQGLEFMKTASALMNCFPSALSLAWGAEPNNNDVGMSVYAMKNSQGCELDFAVVSASGVMRYNIHDMQIAEFQYADAHDHIISRRARHIRKRNGKSEVIAEVVDSMNCRLEDIMTFEFIPRNETNQRLIRND